MRGREAQLYKPTKACSSGTVRLDLDASCTLTTVYKHYELPHSSLPCRSRQRCAGRRPGRA